MNNERHPYGLLLDVRLTSTQRACHPFQTVTVEGLDALSSYDLGAPIERIPAAQRSELQDRFARTVGILGDGSLMLPAPFDVATSVALAENTIKGDDAEAGFTAQRSGVRTRFRMLIEEVAEDSDVAPRAIVRTVQGNLAALHMITEALVMEQDPGGA